MESNKYKRMAKNAGMLYFRMLLTIAVALYTSRVILQILGVEDFGIYNVVAGFVTMLGFLHGAMSSATQRFLAFELGQSGKKDVRGIFSMSMNIHILIAVIVWIVGETLGLWFVRTQLTIPIDRIFAAEWVFHLSLVSFMVTIISVPYNALIIAHEQMNIFAAVSILDVILKLLIVFMLGWFGMDKLILYGLLSLTVVFIIFMVYRSYCKYKFLESKFRFYWDRKLFNIMLSYTGWNLWGTIAAVMSAQGINVLLNIFFGPAVNAARAISMQVAAALNQFVQNVQIAVNPQIIKSYAKNDIHYMHNLVIIGAKYNYLLLLLLSMPVFINAELILELWLRNVPEYSTIFLRIIMLNILVDSISAPLRTSAQATGKIKVYQSIVGGILLFNVPISYFILKSGGSPESVVYVGIFISIAALIARLIILKKIISLPIRIYIKDVIFRCSLVTIVIIILYKLIWTSEVSSLNFILQSMLICLISLTIILMFGVSKAERIWMLSIGKNFFKKITNNNV